MSPKHPVLDNATFGLISAEKPIFTSQVQGEHEALGQHLKQLGLHAEPTSGRYKDSERSYIVHNATLPQMQHLGKIFGQESVVHSENGHHRLVYTNGPNEGKYHAADLQNPIQHFEQPPDDYYTSLPGHGHFRINFDFNKLHDLNPVEVAKKEQEYTPAEAASFLVKSISLKLQPHPHAYSWHDLEAEPVLVKDETPPMGHPHMDTPPKVESNDQAAGVGAPSYKKFAMPYGEVNQGTQTNLLHYPYHGKLPEIEKLVSDHGFKTYYAGGKFGKPDLANKHYDTGHLMVYDPTPQSGGDFGHEEYTKGWRQIHELAHALTKPELNKIYGEGKRMGKLGTHRSTNEALRAVHWEWLAAHKQRELSKQVGVHIPDESFHKELGTVMHDAVHRAITGKFTEPSGEGFTPHGHKVPLHTALQMVRDHANQLGLKGLHDVLPKSIKKSESPGPAAAPIAPKMQVHNTVEGFMGSLKKLPKEGPARGKHITEHMNNAAFLTALGGHPQGKAIHAMLTNHLNSVANAGPKFAQVTMKSEHAIFQAGEKPVANEKSYSPNEVNDILMKATKEKVEAFEKEIAHLRELELKKSLIPNHKHNQGSQASGGIEDVPPGKANPKGIDKAEESATKGLSWKEMARHGANSRKAKAAGSKAKTIHHSAYATNTPKEAKAKYDNHPSVGEYTIGAHKPYSVNFSHTQVNDGGMKHLGNHSSLEEAKAAANKHHDAMAEKTEKSELCVKCAKAHGELEKCGEMTVRKADLVDEKGRRTDNHTVDGAVLPKTKKTKQVNKDGGSGGIILPGANLKKAENPPEAKPPGAAPKAAGSPKMPTAPSVDSPKMAKTALPAAKVQMAQQAKVDGSKAGPAAPPPAVKLPDAKSQETRAANYQAAVGGEFTPKTPVVSGLELASTKKPALASPKAAGVTNAKPKAAISGIFGKIFGK